ncbi:MAG TPA: hypothetical protein VJM34_01775 [Novosphingobium sp.]|nr:hypothetical protein [Novosphingobium sp.]
MTGRALSAAVALGLAVAGCGERASTDQAPRGAASSEPAPVRSPVARTGSSGIEPRPPAEVGAQLDFAALDNRDDPDALLRFYGEMIAKSMFTTAARAWDGDAGMTGDKLRALYGGANKATLTFGRGEQEGACGSLYYEAPVTVDFADGRESVKGTVTLRRVNDVPGASEEQLNWRIETSTPVPSE